MPGRKGSSKRESQKSYSWLFLVVFFILVAILTVSLYYLFFKGGGEQPEINMGMETSAEEITSVPEEPKVPAIDLQPAVDEWVNSVRGDKSVLIYDLERDEKAAEYNTTENYSIASLYKLFVVYEGYRRVQSGEWDGAEMAGSTGYTISKCLDLAIRESHSICAETLWAKIGHDELEQIIEDDFGITDSDISELISNAEDITKIMKIFYEHRDITDETLVAAMKDSFLNQPPTTYVWRQGLPSGFSSANVYNKVGWDYNADGGYWNLYHDAAIIEFPETNRHFIVVVMTNHIDFKNIVKLGSEIEKKILTENEA